MRPEIGSRGGDGEPERANRERPLQDEICDAKDNGMAQSLEECARKEPVWFCKPGVKPQSRVARRMLAMNSTILLPDGRRAECRHRL